MVSNRTSEGTIYVMGVIGSGHVKIGITRRRISDRLAEIQSYCPVPLWLLCCRRGTFDEEARLHREFSPFHLHGEWFNLPDDVLKSLINWGGIQVNSPIALELLSDTKLMSEQWPTA